MDGQRTCVTASLLLTVIAGFAHAQPPFPDLAASTPQACVERARKQLDFEQLTKAVADCDAALKLDADYAAAYVLRGRAKLLLEIPDEAQADFDRALKLDPGSVEALLGRSGYFQWKRQYELAAADIDAVLKLAPESSEAYIRRGSLLEAQNKYKAAESDYTNAIRLDPQSVRALTSRGEFYGNIKAYDQSLADADRAIGIDPSFPDAYRIRASAYARLKKQDSALADASKRIELTASAPSLISRAYLYNEFGKYDSAIVDCRTALRTDPNADKALEEEGWAHKAQKKYDQALKSFEELLVMRRKKHGDKHIGIASVLVYLGETKSSLGDKPAARSAYEQALTIRKDVLGEKHPSTATSLNKLGVFCSSMGDKAAARSYYEQALAIRKEVLGEKHPDTVTSLNNLGSLLSSMGEKASARPYYEQALVIRNEVLGKKHLDTVTSLNNLGFLLKSMGDYGAARPYFEQALAIRKEVLGDKHLDTAQSLNNLGLLLDSMKDYVAARPYYEQALAIRKAALGDKHPDTATSLNNLGVLLHSMKDFVAARPYLEQALAIRTEVSGAKHSDTAASLTNLGAVLWGIGDNAAARNHYEQALTIRKDVLGDKHPDTVQSMNNLGLLLDSMKDYAAARRYYEQALAVRKEVLGDNHPDTATSFDILGVLLCRMDDGHAARPFLERAVAIRNDVLGENHPDTAAALWHLASAYIILGDYATAFPLRQRATDIYGGEGDADTKQFGLFVMIRGLGDQFEELINDGKYVDGLRVAKVQLEACEAARNDKRRNSARDFNVQEYLPSLLRSGGMCLRMGEPATGRLFFEKAQDDAAQNAALAQIASDDFVCESVTYKVQAISGIGKSHLLIGDYSTSLVYMKKALKGMEELRRDVLPSLKDAKDENATFLLDATLDSLEGWQRYDLSLVLHKLGDYKGASEHLDEAFRRLATYDKDNKDSVKLLVALGGISSNSGNDERALQSFERGLSICKKHLGDTHPEVAECLFNLGILHQKKGDYAAARQYFQQAFVIDRESLGERHPKTSSLVASLSELCAASGDWTRAFEYQESARRAVRYFTARELPAMSPKEQLTFLRETDEKPFHVALTLGLVRRASPEACRLSASWSINGKALSQEALAQQSLLTAESNNPAVQDQVTQLLSLRRQLASLSLSAPKPGEEQSRLDHLAKLEADEQALSRQVSQAVGRPVSQEPWIELDRVRAQLPAKSVLVDLARFDVFDFAAKGKEPKWKPAHYAAWLTPHEGEVQIVDLGAAEPIEAQVKAVREALKASMGPQGKIAELGEPEAEQLVQAELQKLAKLIFEPLLPHLKDAEELVLSPDGALWLVPWGALPLADGKYAIEQYRMRYVVSGRDLVRQTASNAKTTNPIVLAAPDYDLNPEQAQATAKTVLGDKYVAPAGEELTVRSANLLPQAAALPGTYVEAQAIRPQLQNYAQSEPTLYTRREALESVFKTVRRPKVLVLATHGFFLEDQEVKPQDGALAMAGETRSIPLTTKGKPVENPLLRCGLLLAGCNQRASQGDDGVLTGLEIVGTDLVGTELVVLSACETGVGEVRNGEGVAGLRQAFQLAGAESVAATLWQVSDVESVRLMRDFFTQLAEGRSKADALRQAQLQAIQSRRDRSGAAHPFFWAAYTVTGK